MSKTPCRAVAKTIGLVLSVAALSAFFNGARGYPSSSEVADTDHEDLKNAYEHVMRETDAYQQHQLEISKRYHQWLLTLSGGALGLSVTFIEKIAGHAPEAKYVLGVSWILLIVALVSQLWSFDRSERLIEKSMQDWQNHYAAMVDAYTAGTLSEYISKPFISTGVHLARVIRALNYIAILCVTAGILGLSYFTFVNIPGS